MTYAHLTHIPLQSAYLCSDCHEVGNCKTQCPACAGTVLLPLAGVLDREPEGPEGIEIVNLRELFTHM